MVENGWVATKDRKIVATGSGSTWHSRNAVTMLNLPPKTVIKALTTTPAHLLGRSDLGSLGTGKAADFVLLDEGYNVLAVWADGTKQK